MPRSKLLIPFVAVLPLLTVFTRAADPLQAFRMPWNDASTGVTDLRVWQVGAAGAKGWVTVSPQANFIYDGQRLRFWGVVIGASDCFPTHDRADAHAARLARFGFNAVRFHHMDAAYDKANVLTDYASGSSRNISADRLEKLHYFVAKLAEKGIFSNINLLVSREFQASDGLGTEITQLAWKDQHILGFFSDAALSLHKEWADRVLKAPNPYRSGLSLSQDPAVAVVEIMNENGLAQKWFEGVLDTLPAVYASQLETKWNSWLHAKYSGSSAMIQAWGAVDQALGGNLLLNSDFSGGSRNWNLEQHNGAVATASVVNDFNGQPAMKIVVSTPGAESWYVQFNQDRLAVTTGSVYTVSFWAKAASATTTMSANVMKAEADYDSYTDGLGLTLGTGWKQYSWSFQSTGSTANARVNFGGLGSATSTVWIADVRLQAGGKIGGVPAGKSLEASTVPRVFHSGGDPAATQLQRKDWFAFMFDCERTYWNAMKSHLKDNIGYKGIVWGTIVANSPPNVQSGLDALDSHSYWQHPTWPVGKDWDTELWTVQNISMVNDLDGGVLGSMALQRAKGMPHNVTEYQHCSPNTYASEGPLLAAAYGALQDWDSMWMFAYNTQTTEYVTGFFDEGGHPGKMANNLIAAAMFRRGDVRRARREYDLAFSPETELQLAVTLGGAWNISNGALLPTSRKLALESRYSLVLGAAAATDGLTTMPAAPSGSVIRSDTGELVWDNSVPSKGVVTVNTPKTKAVIGFTAGRSFNLGGVSITPGVTRQDWCTVGVTLLEGQAFDHPAGGRAIIVTTGDIENTGMVWKDATRSSVGTKWGSAPVLIEVVPCTVTLPVTANRVQAWTLDAQGQRLASLTVTDSGGRARLNLGANGTTLWYEVLISAGAKAAPSVTSEPMSSFVKPGEPAAFEIACDGFPSPAIQWTRNGVAIPGANTNRFVIASATAADAGIYRAVLTNDQGSLQSREVMLAIDDGDPAKSSTLAALATRAQVGIGDAVMIAGFIVEGSRDVVIGATGPSLKVSSGIQNALMNPKLELWPLGAAAASAINDDWNKTELGEIVKQLNLSVSDPKEACLRSGFSPGPFTVIMKSTDDKTGVGLLELYDTHQGKPGKMHALATRAMAGADEASLIVGFVIEGQRPGLILVRALGPGMQASVGSPAVADPKMTLFKMTPQGNIPLRSNDDWGDDDAASMRAAFASSNAAPLPENSRDASLLVWLEPGAYSAVMSSKGDSALGMVEVYQVR